MDTRAFHAHACAYGVDTVVVAFYGDFGAFARYAGNGADIDQAVVDFGHLKFEEADEEEVACAADSDLGVVVLVVDV